MSGLPWFRMYTEFLDDPKMISIAFEDQRHFFAVCALKADGVLDQAAAEKTMNRIVAQKIWVDYAIIEEVKNRLIDAELIDLDWQPLAWERRQRRSDSDPSGAERQARHREKKAAEKRNALRNAIVTPPDKIRGDKNKTPLSVPDAQMVVSAYKQSLPNHQQPVMSRWKGSVRERELRARWKENPEHRKPEFWDWFFATVTTNPHWMGENDRGWKPDIEWLLKRANFDKVIQRGENNAER